MKKYSRLSSAAVVIGVLRFKIIDKAPLVLAKPIFPIFIKLQED